MAQWCKKMKPIHFVVFALVAIVSATAEECAITQGFNPVYSPDGDRIAFQRLEGGVFKIGVVELPERGRLASGCGDGAHAVASAPPAVEWIEAGPGNAAYPAWTPDCSLIYTYGHDTETAHEAWKNGSRSGYGLRIREPDGTKRDLTRGRCRDYAPCVSPDGQTVFFVTTRGVESESASFSKAAATRLAEICLAHSSQSAPTGSETNSPANPSPANPSFQQSAHPSPENQSPHQSLANQSPPAIAAQDRAQPLAQKILLDSPNGSNSGYVQPAVSPDGSMLVWGQMDSFFEGWSICGMRLGEAASQESSPRHSNVGDMPKGRAGQPVVRLTPASVAALSPRWHPNGRMICFTGFRAGDPGWGVWVFDLPSGKVRRLCSGENPCFSPDGATIAYDCGGMIRVRPFGPGDEPDATLPDIREEDAPEAIVWDCKIEGSEKHLDISGESHFAIGDDTTMFIRATLNLGTQKDTRQFLRLSYAEHPRAIQLYASGGDLWFVSFDHAGKFFAAKAPLPRDGREAAVVAVRTPTRLILSVNGAAPAVVHTGGAIPLDTPQGLTAGDGVLSLEIGTGWPHELPKPQPLEVPQ